jgi:hypothetical protein
MENHFQHLMMVGLAESGKSSFLQAIDELLQHPPSKDALCSTGLAHDRTYIEQDKALYRAGKVFERTSRTPQGAPPELWFSDPTTGRQGKLIVPDVSGEIYRDQWAGRVWPRSYAESLSNVSGILLFVRADLPASNAELLGALIAPNAPPGTLKDWNPRQASTQVQLVDILQFIAIRGEVARPMRVAVILSAWDVVEKMGPHALNPEEFLENHWAMLSQFLRTNDDTFEVKIYGVSARGGTFEELEELRKKPPTERVKIVDDAHSSRDLTRPLRWLLGLF